MLSLDFTLTSFPPDRSIWIPPSNPVSHRKTRPKTTNPTLLLSNPRIPANRHGSRSREPGSVPRRRNSIHPHRNNRLFLWRRPSLYSKGLNIQRRESRTQHPRTRKRRPGLLPTSLPHLQHRDDLVLGSLPR